MTKWITILLLVLLIAGWLAHRGGMMGPSMRAMMGTGMPGRGMMGMMGGPRGQDTIAPNALPSPDSRGARSYKRVCSACHALPDPGLHRANEWPHIVERMLGNMDRAGRPRPDRASIDSILKYLEEHAASH